MDIKQHMEDLTDAELLAAVEEVKEDLTKASIDAPGSEWHQACFAGAVLYCDEMQRRGLRLGTVH